MRPFPTTRASTSVAPAPGLVSSRPPVRARAAGLGVGLALALGVAADAQAWQLYVQAGLPTLGIGVAHPLGERAAFRIDYATTGTLTERTTEEGIDYDARGRLARFGVFGDWFPAGGGFRFTAGLTFNQSELALSAVPDGNSITLGGQTYPVQPGDRFDATIDVPDVTPYVGFGWGRASARPGWHVVADLGVSIGRARLTGAVGGPLASAPGVDEAVERELVELRDGVGKVRVIPQASIGIAYRF